VAIADFKLTSRIVKGSLEFALSADRTVVTPPFGVAA
jgi:hypothetical protein